MRELNAESDDYKWMHIGQPSHRRARRPRRASRVSCAGRKRQRAADL